jgi:hypothetical protein
MSRVSHSQLNPYPAAPKKLEHSWAEKSEQMFPMAFQRLSMVLEAVVRRRALSLEKTHFNGIEFGAVGRQKEKPCAPVPDEGFGPLAHVAREVIQDDDVAGLEGGCELGLHIGFENEPVHRRVNDPG